MKRNVNVKRLTKNFGKDSFSPTCDQYNRHRSIHAPLTKASAPRLLNEMNEEFGNDEKLTHSYFEGRLSRFKVRYNLERFKSQKADDAPYDAISSQRTVLTGQLQQWNLAEHM